MFYDLIFRYFPRTFYFLPGKKLLFNLSCVSTFMDGRNLEFSLFFIRTVINLIIVSGLLLIGSLILTHKLEKIPRKPTQILAEKIVAMIDGMVERMEQELGSSTTVVATGGIARFVLPLCRTAIHYERDLILQGLGMLYRDNVRGSTETPADK